MGRFRQNLLQKRQALQAIENLTPEQHDQFIAAVNGMTPQDTAALANASATGGSHPILDMLTGFITDPTQLAAVVKFIMAIIALIPK
jgi:hypothetical protein